MSIADEYAGTADPPPLAPYLALSAGFVGALSAFVVARRRSGGLPERIAASDLALAGVASFKLSRLVTKKKVAAPLRAPFTRYQGEGDAPGEVEERARGTGVRAAIGQLLTCPYCVGVWVATAFTAGVAAAPRETRVVTSSLTVLGVSDLLHAAYRRMAA
jgi:hypothetical protein